MKNRKRIQAAVAPYFLISLVSAMLVSFFSLPLSVQGQGLPSRAFEVKSGSVQIQGGLLGLRDEVLLFMVVGNKTGKTFWAEIEFRIPKTGKLLTDFEKIKKGGSNMFRWPVSKVFWDTEYPFTVSIYEDKRRKKLVGSEQSTFFFEGDEDREVFEKQRVKLSPGQATAINGFREIREPNLSAKVPGTAANSQLQRDITLKLFEEASKYHKECEHRVLKAEAYEATEPSVIFSGMGGKDPGLAKRLRAKGNMLIEKWSLKSCETVSIYEVLLLKSGTGTDIAVKILRSRE